MNMNFKINNQNLYLIIFILFALISFVVGFNLDEVASSNYGGFKGDLFFIWNNQNTFNNHSLKEALNFTTTFSPEFYQSSRIPSSYILNKYLNPFSDDINNFRRSVFFFSLCIPLFFFYALKEKFTGINKYLIGAVSSIVLLSPYFRNSGFWGLEENYAFLTTIISYIFLNKFLKYNLNKNYLNFSYIFYISFFSSLCVYFDQKFIIIPLICFIKILISDKLSVFKYTITLFYFLFSLPCLYLFYLWGNFLPVQDASTREMGLNNLRIANIGYAITIIAFYLTPILFLKKEKNYSISGAKDLLKFSLNKYLIFLFILYLLYFFNFNDFSPDKLGGGFVNKISYFLFDDFLHQKYLTFFAFIFGFLIILFFINNNINDFLIITFFLIISVFANPLYQEYFDPVIFILALTFFDTKLIINFKNVAILYFSFLIFFSASYLYYTYV